MWLHVIYCWFDFLLYFFRPIVECLQWNAMIDWNVVVQSLLRYLEINIQSTLYKTASSTSTSDL